MNYVKIFSSTLAIALLVVGCGLTKGNVVEPKPQATCPVMGDKIACLILDKDIYMDYEGNRIYFCSKGCLEKFKMTKKSIGYIYYGSQANNPLMLLSFDT
ncbi:MAG: hypothetical protein ACYTFM_11800 [Planctomycetota bacterium]|jgi:YHS domain-containing protein